MSAPKVIKRPKPQTVKAASPKKPTTGEAKTRKPRKPPLDRAVRAVELIEKKCNLLTKNVARWQPERGEVRELQTTIVELRARATDLGSIMVTLLDEGFVPTVGRGGGGRTPLAAGDLVTIRETRYEPEAHGPNTYRVAALCGHLFEIESQTQPERKHFVPRAWLVRVGAPVDAASVSEDSGEGAD